MPALCLRCLSPLPSTSDPEATLCAVCAVPPPTLPLAPIDPALLTGPFGDHVTLGNTLPPAPEQPTIPGYEILGELGRGGMGVVYKARQIKAERLVALKVILSGEHSDEQTRERFRREARAAAQLHHPGIVQIHEVGEYNALPFFSMEFIPGGSLADLLREGPLTFPHAAALVEQIARAAFAAHEAGLIHRDLKPANVLLSRSVFQSSSQAVEENDAPAGRLPDSLVPKITDFGLARQVQDQGHTVSGAIIGTPSYMAPEQARGQGKIGPRADGYALGAILYECLTGRPPFLGSTPLETMTQVIADDPLPPRTLRPGCPRDLETICLRCLHKDPQRRYVSALSLANDLHNFLAGEPIIARRVGAVERGIKWARRRPALSATLLLLVLFLFGSFGLIAYIANQAEQNRKSERLFRLGAEEAWHAEQDQRRIAQKALAEAKESSWQTNVARAKEFQARREIERTLYFNRIAFADRELSALNINHANELLNLCPPTLRHWEWGYLKGRGQVARSSLDIAWAPITGIALSPDGKVLAIGVGQPAQMDGTAEVQLRDARTLQLIRTLPLGHSGVTGLRFSKDGKHLVAIGMFMDVAKMVNERLTLEKGTTCESRVWEVASGKMLERRPRTSALVWNTDGTLLARATLDRRVEVWKPGAEKLQFRTLEVPGVITELRFSPCGKWLAGVWQQLTPIGSAPQSPNELYKTGITVWKVPGGKEVYEIKDGTALDFPPEGRSLAAALLKGTIEIHDLTTRRKTQTMSGHRGIIGKLLFARSTGKGTLPTLASAGYDRTARLWNPNTGRALQVLTGHTSSVLGLTFANNDKELITGSMDRTVKVWSIGGDGNTRTFLAAQAPTGHLTFAGDSQFVLLASAQSVRCWDLNTNKEVNAFRKGRLSLAKAANAPRLAVYFPGEVRLYDTRNLVGGDLQQPIRTVTLGGTMDPMSMALSADGSLLAMANTAMRGGAITGEFVVVQPGRATPLWKHQPVGDVVIATEFDPQGKYLALLTLGGILELRDPKTGKLFRSLRRGDRIQGTFITIRRLAFSPDGKTLAEVGGNTLLHAANREIRLWDVATGKLSRRLTGHTSLVSGIAFSPDGKRLVSASLDTERGIDGEVKLWDVQTGTDLLTLEGQVAVAFSPDGKRIASVGLQIENIHTPVIRIRDALPWK